MIWSDYGDFQGGYILVRTPVHRRRSLSSPTLTLWPCEIIIVIKYLGRYLSMRGPWPIGPEFTQGKTITIEGNIDIFDF